MRAARSLRGICTGCITIATIMAKIIGTSICPAWHRWCGVYMARHLPHGQSGLPDSASKTHTPPANLRRTPLCHPDHHFKRKERRQAVAPVCAPLKRMGMGLGAAYGTRCHSSLPKTGSPATEATRSPYDPLRGMRVTRHLLCGQGRFADSASKTDIFPKKQITGGYYV